MGAYPANKYSGDDHLFYEAIDNVTCPEGNVTLEKARLATLDHAMRHVHKGGLHGRAQLAEAVSGAVLRRSGVRNESIFENLRDKALSHIVTALNVLEGSANLYNFEFGIAFFPFLYAFLKWEVRDMVDEQNRSVENEPPTYDEIHGAEGRFLDGVNRASIDRMWKALVLLQPELLHYEERLIRHIERFVRARPLKPKKRECLDRAITIIREGLADGPGHSVKLFGGAGPECETPLLLAIIVTAEAAQSAYNHSNGATLTANLPCWLDTCIGILVEDAEPAELRNIADLVRTVLEMRKHTKTILERIGWLHSGLGDEGFSHEKWNGAAHIEIRGRVTGSGVSNSGLGIAGYGGLFGCVPHESPGLARLLAAGAGVVDFDKPQGP